MESSSLFPLGRRLTLESLPIEIIRKIFFESLEINLPRASPFISRILSDQHVYTWLIRLAFSSSNESSRDGFFTESFLPTPLDFFALSPSDRANLQTSILECRWCTLPLMRRCQREYMEHVIRRKCHDLRFAPEDRKKLTNLDAAFSRLADYEEASGGRRSKGDLIVPAKARDGSDLKVAIWFNSGSIQIREPSLIFYEMDVFRLPCCPAENPPRMPRKLLHPPWTPAKLEFLSFLATKAYIDEDNSYHRSKRILRQVIRDRDFSTFKRLLETVSIRTRVYNYPLRWPARPSHFQAALNHAEGRNDPFIRFLVDNRWDELASNATHANTSNIRAAMLDNLRRVTSS